MSASSPKVRTGFATTPDNLRLYWRVVGEGPPMVCCNGVGVSIFFWKYLVEHYAPHYSILLWDYRGHGRSDRLIDVTTADLSIDRHAQDLTCVMDAAGFEKAILVGHSMGCQVIFETWRRFPARVNALVPMLGSAGRTLETFFDYNGSPRYFRMVARLIDKAGPAAHYIVRPLLESPLAWAVTRNFGLVDKYYCQRDDMLTYLRHIASLDLRLFIHTVLMTNEHDAWEALPRIDIPVLIVAAENDAFTPGWLSRKMHREIRDAEFLMLADGSHAALIEQPKTILHRMDRFLQDRLEKNVA